MFERSNERVEGDERSGASSVAPPEAGSNPLRALATKGLEPARADAHSAQTTGPEVVPKPTRRVYTNEYKLKIIREAEALTGTGQIGAMLRREGLYDQQLSEWRRAAAAGLHNAKRGPKPKPVDPYADENKALRRENMLLKRKLARAEVVIDIQKKWLRCWGFRWPRPTATRTADASRGQRRSFGSHRQYLQGLRSVASLLVSAPTARAASPRPQTPP